MNFIQSHSRHRVPSMILEYSRLEEEFENHAGKGFLKDDVFDFSSPIWYVKKYYELVNDSARIPCLKMG